MSSNQNLEHILKRIFLYNGTALGYFSFVKSHSKGIVVSSSIWRSIWFYLALSCQFLMASYMIFLVFLFDYEFSYGDTIDTTLNKITGVLFYLVHLSAVISALVEKQLLLKIFKEVQFLQETTCLLGKSKLSGANFLYWFLSKWLFDITLTFLLSYLLASLMNNTLKIDNGIYNLVLLLYLLLTIYGFITSAYYVSFLFASFLLQKISDHLADCKRSFELIRKHKNLEKLILKKIKNELPYLAQCHDNVITFTTDISNLLQFCLIFVFSNSFLGLITMVLMIYNEIHLIYNKNGVDSNLYKSLLLHLLFALLVIIKTLYIVAGPQMCENESQNVKKTLCSLFQVSHYNNRQICDRVSVCVKPKVLSFIYNY